MNDLQRARNVWRAILHRCYNPKNKEFANYGARGIRVCERWHDFRNFVEDLGVIPRGMTVDRSDNTRGYSPENCRLATAMEQANNRRSNRRVTFNGKTKTLAEWSRATDIPQRTLWERLSTLQWPVEKALTKPVRPLYRMITHKGRTMPLKAWAKEVGRPYNTIGERIDSGMSVEDALTTPSHAIKKPYVINHCHKDACYELRITGDDGRRHRFGRYETLHDAEDVAEAMLSGKAF